MYSPQGIIGTSCGWDERHYNNGYLELHWNDTLSVSPISVTLEIYRSFEDTTFQVFMNSNYQGLLGGSYTSCDTQVVAFPLNINDYYVGYADTAKLYFQSNTASYSVKDYPLWGTGVFSRVVVEYPNSNCNLTSSVTGTDVVCNGSCNGSATVTGVGGALPYSYLWNTGATTSTINNLCVGTYTVTVTDTNGCQSNSTQVINSNGGMNINIVTSNASCSASCDGGATATVTGGASPYSYSWSLHNYTTGTSTTSNNNLCAGTYTVDLTVTDTLGCTNTISDSLYISSTNSLSISTTVTNMACNVTCDGSSVATVNGGVGPYSYLWSNGDSSSTATNLCTGSYTVNVEDANGCTGTSSVTITQGGVTSSVTGTDVVCNGSCNGSATVTGVGGALPYSYLWNTGATTSTINNLCVGTYTVTVTDTNGCQSNSTQVINSNGGMNINIATSNASCSASCDGGATATVTGGASPYSYSWNIYNTQTGNTTTSNSNLCEGSYAISLTVTDSLGCTNTITSSDSLISSTNSLSISTTVTNMACNVTCDGSSVATVNGGVGPYVYMWSNGDTISTANNLCAGAYTVDVTDANGCTGTSSVTITQGGVTSSVTGTDVVCNGSCNGSATVTGVGGALPYSYLWNTGATTSTINNLCVGTYTVTVTDTNGCQSNSTQVINSNGGMNINIVTSNASCSASCDGGATATVTGGASPYSYSWSLHNYTTGTSTTSNNNLCAGTYTVDLTVTDTLGCTNTISDSLYISSTNSLSISTTVTNMACNVTCDGSSVATVNGGVGPYSYLWSNGDSSSTATNLCTGSYTVNVEDANGCTGTSSVTITQGGVTSSVTGTDVVCNGSCNGSATVTGVGGALPYSYLWNTGATTSTINNLCVGTYTVTVTDTNGCQSNSTQVINSNGGMNINIATSNASCSASCDGGATATVTGGASPYSYSWSLYNYTTGTSTTSNNNLCAGTYTVDLTVTDTLGCTNTISDSLYISSTNSLSISTTVTNMACNGTCSGSATATVSGGVGPYSYLWSNGDSSSTATNLCTGSYTVNVEDANGCTGTSSVTITQGGLNASISINDVTCNGLCDGLASANIVGSSPPYNYQWSNGMIGSSITNICAGDITLFLTDSNGCEVTITDTINEPISMSNNINITQPSCGLNNGSAEVMNTFGGVGPYSYQWSNGSLNALADSLTSGYYTVTVTDANGCILIETINIASVNSPSISINTISPSCHGGSNGEIDITIVAGANPITYDWSTGENTEDISNLTAGIYDVTIIDSSGCGIVEVITLNDAPIIDLSSYVSNDATCGNSDGSLAVFASGGVGGLNFLWSSGETTPILSGLSTGSYTLSVSDGNGCLAMSSYSISNINGPSINIDQINEPSCQGGDGDILISISGGVLPYSYLWNNGSTNEDLLNASIGNYELVVTDSLGCQGVEYTELLGINFAAAEICMVTVDTATEHNLIVWGKYFGLGISQYEIYKETSVLNVFQLLGTVPFDSLSQFVDTAANSSLHSYRYKLRTLDSCGNASDFLAYHKTIHLVANLGLNNVVNLVWDDYIGFSYSSFYINRHHPTTGWVVIDSVASNVHSYTDNNYPSLIGLEYSIGVRPPSNCAATKSINYMSAISNRKLIVNTVPSFIVQHQNTNLNIYPNPTSDQITIDIKGYNGRVNVDVYDLQGRLLETTTNTKVSLKKHAKGIYVLKVSYGEITEEVRVVKD